MIDTLSARATVLKAEVERASQNVQTLSTQLQQATIHMHTVGGHFNEVAYLLGEAQKTAGVVPPETPLSPVPHEHVQEQEDGQADCQEQEQTPEE